MDNSRKNAHGERIRYISPMPGRMRPKRSYKTLTGVLVVFLAICFLAIGTTLADKAAGIRLEKERLAATRAALEKWVENQRIISKEKRDFALAKEMLTERIGLVENEVEQLQGKIEAAEESITEADKKRVRLIEESEKLEAASASLEGVLASLEVRTRDLLTRLPEQIQDRVKLLSEQLPTAGEETRLTVSQRFQNVVGILNEVDKFSRDITVTSELRTLADGSTVEVAVLYVGIGQAYYASANGQYAGIGLPTDSGWQWKPYNEAAPNITEAIAIFKNEKVASFVQLPVEIQ